MDGLGSHMQGERAYMSYKWENIKNSFLHSCPRFVHRINYKGSSFSVVEIVMSVHPLCVRIYSNFVVENFMSVHPFYVCVNLFIIFQASRPFFFQYSIEKDVLTGSACKVSQCTFKWTLLLEEKLCGLFCPGIYFLERLL